jgi:hypothetical protein
MGTTKVWLEAAAARVACPEHGPTVVAVPWARHDAGHTLAFDDQVAWLAVHTSRSAVAALMPEDHLQPGTSAGVPMAHGGGVGRAAPRPDLAGGPQWTVSVGSTVVRAQKHVAGARHEPVVVSHTGRGPNGSNSRRRTGS